ncbi:MAG: hypothetical protein ACTH2U_16845 [Brevibacterium sp.]|uniref:hypothetical protein n=2 Tax=Brachybacterium alimentarium TaxID=47845 RepID=UPI000DF33863|nr:hypothetical protein [Brachybacterium alimentarium]RCS65955.1 hypothetical protein CIK68_16375 [Brachybacterium alimentarium]RCS79052.1 hypothetical protein CIK67_18155 [Brachybacterium alimentarium]
MNELHLNVSEVIDGAWGAEESDLHATTSKDGVGRKRRYFPVAGDEMAARRNIYVDYAHRFQQAVDMLTRQLPPSQQVSVIADTDPNHGHWEGMVVS